MRNILSEGPAMPVRWEFRSSLLVVISTGVYPNEAVEDAVRQAAGDPRFQPGMSVLFDGRDSEVAVSSADVDWRVRFFGSLHLMGFSPRVALLVREGFLAAFSTGRLVSLGVPPTGWEVEPESRTPAGAPALRVFSDEDEAVAWLRVGP
jgi:hypothetical protein